MVEEYTHGEMVEDMKVNINTIRNMVKEFTFGQMEEVFRYNIIRI